MKKRNHAIILGLVVLLVEPACSCWAGMLEEPTSEAQPSIQRDGEAGFPERTEVGSYTLVSPNKKYRAKITRVSERDSPEEHSYSALEVEISSGLKRPPIINGATGAYERAVWTSDSKFLIFPMVPGSAGRDKPPRWKFYIVSSSDGRSYWFDALQFGVLIDDPNIKCKSGATITLFGNDAKASEETPTKGFNFELDRILPQL